MGLPGRQIAFEATEDVMGAKRRAAGENPLACRRFHVLLVQIRWPGVELPGAFPRKPQVYEDEGRMGLCQPGIHRDGGVKDF